MAGMPPASSIAAPRSTTPQRNNPWVRFRPTVNVLAFLVVASAALDTSGLGCAAAQFQTRDPSPVRFAIETSKTTWAKIPGSPATRIGQGYPGEEYRLVLCGWPSNRASITVTEAKTFRCSPYAVGLSVPAPGSFEVLSSPIADKWPESQNGGLSRELRFVKREGNVLEVGPNLMEYGDYSGGARPSFDETGGSLWIFDYRTEHGPEAIRVSTSSGEILQRTRMPPISRPIIGANALGFWLAQDSTSEYPSGTRLGVWFAPLGASTSELVKVTDGSAWAMRADGKAMDVFISPNWPARRSAVDLWRFTPRS